MKNIDPTLFELVLSVGGGAIALLVAKTFSSINELKAQINELSNQIRHLELLVVGNYVRREQFDQTTGVLFRKHDKLEDQLHELDKAKQDKQPWQNH